MAGAKKPREKKDETGTGTKPCEFKEEEAKEEANKCTKEETKTQEEEEEEEGAEHNSQNTKEIQSSKKD